MAEIEIPTDVSEMLSKLAEYLGCSREEALQKSLDDLCKKTRAY